MKKQLIYIVTVNTALSGDIILGAYMSYFDAWTIMSERILEYISMKIEQDQDSDFIEYEGKDQDGKEYGWKNNAHSIWEYKDTCYSIVESVFTSLGLYDI